jgi:CubicO group peptidase (beta-lactamase class C family)
MSVFPFPLWQEMGLPEAPEDHPECSGLGTSPACQAEDIIDYISHAPPTYSPFNQPVYSNLAYAVLGMVVEAASGEKFADFVQKNIFDVAGMNSTFFDGADSSDLLEEKGFIPFKEGTWNRTLGVYEP